MIMLRYYDIQYDNHNEIVHININRREYILLYNNTCMKNEMINCTAI